MTEIDPGLIAPMESDAPTRPPALFVRLVTVPPGLPWDQRRMVQLEMLNSAPIGREALRAVAHRLERWRPQTPGRFAVGYVRRDEIAEGGIIVHVVEGRPVEFYFPNLERERRRAAALTVTAAVAGFAAIVCGLAIKDALAERARAHEVLSGLERRAEQVELRTGVIAAAKADSEILDDAGVRGEALSDVLDDLAWASRARLPEATITSVRWNDRDFEVVAQGRESPFATRDRIASPRSVGAGATAWKISGKHRPS